MAERAAESPWAMVWEGPGRKLRRRSFGWPALRPGEALARIRLATLCGSDLHTASGRREGPAPGILGHEAVGDIVAVGAGGVRDLDGAPIDVGSRVTWSMMVSCGGCFSCRHGLPQKCQSLRKYGHAALEPGWELHGGLASHIVLLSGTTLVPLPEALPDAVACPANCATATVAAAWRLAELQAGETVLIHGAGMLGLSACAMAAAAGATVIMVDPAPERRARATAFGAGAVSGGEGLAEQIGEATAGRGADVALDVSGSPEALAEALRQLRVGGRAIWVGSVFPAPPVPIDAEQVVRRMLTIRGLHNYTPNDLRQAVAFLTDHHQRFPFVDLVERVHPLGRADEAFADAEESRAVRIGVRPNGDVS